MISLFGSHVGKEELASITSSFDKQWLGLGPKTTEFEKKLKQKLGSGSVLFVNSGSNSLLLATKLMDLPAGSEVILPSFTWIACANAIVLNNLRPVFCDVDRVTCNMRAEDVAKKMTSKTSAIMVVHYAGKPVDMDSLSIFSLPIIEDAAHAIDSTYRRKHCGTFGKTAIFSFDAVKNLTTGEGGALVTSDPILHERAAKLRYCGIAKSGFQASATKTRWWEYDILEPFPKLLNTDIAASIGLAQLEKLPQFQKIRKTLWELYSSELETGSWNQGWLIPPARPGLQERHSYFTYCIQLTAGNRDSLAHFLIEHGIYSSLRFHPLHLNPCYGSTDRLENSEWLNERALNIPLHHRMALEDAGRVLDALKKFKERFV